MLVEQPVIVIFSHVLVNSIRFNWLQIKFINYKVLPFSPCNRTVGCSEQKKLCINTCLFLLCWN